MKNSLLKKISSFIISVMMIFSISSEAYATELTNQEITESDIISIIENDFGDLFTEVIEYREEYELDNFIDDSIDTKDIKILNEIDINDISFLNDSNASTQNYPVKHLPVTANNNIIMIFDIIKTENGYSTTLGTDFAPLLNKAKQDGNTSINLYQDGLELYAYTDEKVYSQIGNSIQSRTSIRQDVLNDSIADNSLSNSDEYELVFSNDKYTQAAQHSICNTITSFEDIQPLSTSLTLGTKYLTNYPIVHQRIGNTQYGMCWAATVASMVRFEKPSTYGSLTAANVCNYMDIGYDEGGTIYESKSALKHYLGSPYAPTVKSVLSFNDIQTVINNVDPAYMECRRKTGTLSYAYHAVALTGYNFTKGYLKIQIMDPAYECLKMCTYDGSNWNFAFGSYTYTWYRTIRLLYNS